MTGPAALLLSGADRLMGEDGLYGLFILFVLLVVAAAAVTAAWDAYREFRVKIQLLAALAGADAADARPAPPRAAPEFVCPDCGARSWHPDDGRYGWCGRCHRFTGRPAGLEVPTTPDDDRETA